MGKKYLKWLFLCSTLLLTASVSYAGVNLELGHKLMLEGEPLDVVATPDGKYVFVLTDKGDIAAFDENGILQNKLHIDTGADQIKMDPQGKRLFVTSRWKKSVQIISLDFFVKINTAGAPSKGPQNAPLVFAVFSDFQ